LPIRRGPLQPKFLVCAFFAAFLLLLGALPALAAAQTFTVNTTVDSSGIPGGEYCTGAVGIQCTLREAIQEANAKEGADEISFAGIPAGSVLEIQEAPLPGIYEGVTIDGYTAEGATPGVPAVELIPNNFEVLESTPGLSVRIGKGTRIEGLAIGGFGIGIELGIEEGGSVEETEICGNYLGTEMNGFFARPNEIGVEVFGVLEERPQRNVIGNGGSCPGNVISGNSKYGVKDYGRETLIAGNSIGLGPQPFGEVIPNGSGDAESAGILETDVASGGRIGGTEPQGKEGNLIVQNRGPGVQIENTVAEVSIRHNSIWGNEGLGIEILAGEMPAPSVTSAESPSAKELVVKGIAVGTDGETVELDFYGSPECGPGEGQTFLGTANVPIGAGPTSYETSIPVEVPADETAITATATREAGQTSEFSACASYVGPPRTYLVTTLNNSYHGGVCGPECSLRDAIEAANQSPNKDTIEFSVAGTIKPEGDILPWITAPVIIDGTTAPGYEAGRPAIEIDGSESANEGRTTGFVVFPEAEGSVIEGLAVKNFEQGVEIDGNHSLLNRDVITDNATSGVFVEGTAPETEIRRTELFGNDQQIEFSAPNTVPEPILEAFVAGPSSTTLIVPLTGAEPNHEYAIDVFANAHCEKPGEHGPAEVFLAAGNVTADGSGEAKAEIAGPALAGINAEVFTVTATDLATGTTSQIGHCSYSPIDTVLESTPPAVTSSTSAEFTFRGETVGTVAGFECSLDGAEYSACNSPKKYTGLASSSHTFLVRALNGEGFGDFTAASYTWEVNAEPPEVSITGGPTGVTNQPSGAFEFTATDSKSPVVSTECKLDGGAFAACNSPYPFSGLTDGSHTFEVRATNELGTTSDPVSRTWEIDTVAPVVTIISAPSEFTNETEATIEYTATDSGSVVTTIECRLDSAAFGPCEPPANYSNLAEGPHTFEVKATDAAGNTSAPVSHSWTVDTEPPEVTITGGPTGVTSSTEARLTFTANDQTSFVTTVECRIDAEAFGACESPETFTDLPDGPHTFEVKATDAAGNTSTPVSRSWTVDTEPPEVTITSGPAGTVNSTTAIFQFAATDETSTVTSIECSLDGAAFSTCASPKEYTGLANGNHKFEVKATDAAGNTSTPVVRNWRVDTETPEVTITAGPSGAVNLTSATFEFTATDPSLDVISVQCSLDGAAFSGCESPKGYTGLAPGAHKFEVKATNEAGNTSEPVVRSWKIVTEAPSPAFTAAPPTSTDATGATFEFNEGGTGGEITGYECSLDAGAYAGCTSPQSFTGLAPGAHTFAVRAKDAAGNTSAPTVYQWTVSNPPPPQQQQEVKGVAAEGPAPSNGEKVVVAPVEGKVLVKLPGTNKYVNLLELKEIPLGAVIDATKGKVTLTSIDPDGTEQTAVFFGGVFKVKQKEGAGLVVLELLDTGSCPASGSSLGRPGGALAARPGKATTGKLWGSGHGNFKTEGNQGSATVRGTIWLVEDRCNGTTFFKTRRGVVSVRDFVLHKTLSLPAGKTYVAGEG
jgi:CSLREA domain-containing protein